MTTTRRRLLVALLVIAAAVAGSAALDLRDARAIDARVARLDLVRAKREAWTARSTLRFFANHPRIRWASRTRPIALREMRHARRDLAAARARIVNATGRLRASRWAVPDEFMQDALCVHDGWKHAGPPGFERTVDVPDSIRGGSGEADWRNRSTYRGGMQFAFSTWRRAGGSGDPADASPAEQVFRARVIVLQDGGSWREWPETARACGLPQ